MTLDPSWRLTVATCLFGLGMWLVLPRRSTRGRLAGTFAALVALGLLGAELPLRAASLDTAVLAGLSILTIAACGAAVVARDPVYAAVRFALALLGVAGLLMYQGAQFLGVATLAVYAGAILVTFLFVLMLAEPWGAAASDVLSWHALVAAASGAIVSGALAGILLQWAGQTQAAVEAPSAAAVDVSWNEGPHVARLGARLYGRHLLSVELVGVILLAALVGAVAIVERGRPVQRETGGVPGHGVLIDSATKPSAIEESATARLGRRGNSADGRSAKA